MRTHVLCGLALLCACATSSQQRPTERLAASMASARTAEESGAREIPEAALYLKLANEEIDEARDFMNRGNNERAAYLSVRAQNDAELSLAIAREDAAKRRAQQAAVMARSRSSHFAATPPMQPPAENQPPEPPQMNP